MQDDRQIYLRKLLFELGDFKTDISQQQKT